MKGLACGVCADVRALPNIGDLTEWTTCRCGNVSARWVDPGRGTAEFRATHKDGAFGIGFNNQFLMPALRGQTAMHEDARRLHDVATAAPGYVFDKSMASCWAIIFRPGATSDTSWAEES